MKIGAAQINPTIGDLEGNYSLILSQIIRAKNEGIDLLVFPEMAICGYPPADFLLLPEFIQAVEKCLNKIAAATSGISIVLGTIRQTDHSAEKRLFNSAAIISNGQIIGFHDKILLPTYDVFDEKRYFSPGNQVTITQINGKNIAITICEDLWQHSGLLHETRYARDPVNELMQNSNLDLLVNLSASPYSHTKFDRRLQVCQKAAKSLSIPILLVNQVGGNDSLIFSGESLFVSREGNLKKIGRRFEEDLFSIDLDSTSTAVSSLPTIKRDIPRPQELYEALCLGLADYLRKTGFKKVCLGLSGGIDSALVAAIACAAIGPENVLCVAMPSRFSSEGSWLDAHLLTGNLGCQFMEIPIEPPFQTFLDVLSPHFDGKVWDVTEENLQARIRGIMLMALSNKHGYLLLSCGNKSEMAVGYATLYGDMCGGLGVISDLPKMLVYEVGEWINRAGEVIPRSIFTKAPSAELREGQKDSDSLPPYDVLDQVLDDYVVGHMSVDDIVNTRGFDRSVVDGLVRKIHRNEYKRRQAAPGLRVTEKAFSVGRIFPIAQRWAT
jgi:NAD+ synthase (glutamine-hydrolysing)